MDRLLPPPGVLDWHFVLHLAVYPERAKLSAVTYRLSGVRPSPSKALFTPRLLQPPTTEWDTLQSTSLAIDILAGKLFP